MADWEDIIRTHGPSVWRTACRLLCDPAEADDCMQDTFLAAVEFSRRQEVREWGALLRRIATSRALDRLRRAMRQKAAGLHAASGGGSNGHPHPTADWGDLPSADPADDPLWLAEAREFHEQLHERLRRALARLSPQQAEAFCLRYLNEMDYCQIAEALQIDVNQVGVVLHRARSRLRELLAAVARAHT
jgi:RNA polymerase sigma-70 factor (ECF subfamily)